GVDYVGCYAEGSNPPPTPNIDSLAQRGVLFRNAYANPSCSPTRACIHTGRFPFRTLVGRWIRYENNSEPIGRLLDSEWTIPEVLDRANSGYAHAAIGKWHMHEVGDGIAVPRTVGGWGHFRGTMLGQVPSYYSWPYVRDGVLSTSTSYITTQQVDDTLEWVGQQTGPWVCYLAFCAPHLPFEVPPAHLHTRNVTANSPRRDLYKAVIEALDTEIGRLFQSLGPVLDQTDVIFLGDNGSVQNTAEAPFRGDKAKGSPYEGGINVPLLVAGPSVVQGGREVTDLACSVDVFSTVLDLAGALPALPPFVEVDGRSLVPHLRIPGLPAYRPYAFAEEFTGDVWPRPNTNGHATVRDARYKLIYRYSGGARELFDLQNDPFEYANLLSRTLSASEQAAYQGLLNEVARLRTPRARFTSFGSTVCQGRGGPPRIGTGGTPRIGSVYQVSVTNAAPFASAVGVLGFHADRLGPQVQLPLDLAPFGAGPGCALEVAVESASPATIGPLGSAVQSFTVPGTAALAGRHLFHQWLVLDGQAPGNALGVVPTGAVAATFGY
ncbi:MAG: sulfatase-like hydrolase/transferase, partial [Planctomycetota bacterium]|nr:sulfatase-like hydrolase/transferase [Planctomycetota bacterium]